MIQPEIVVQKLVAVVCGLEFYGAPARKFCTMMAEFIPTLVRHCSEKEIAVRVSVNASYGWGEGDEACVKVWFPDILLHVLLYYHPFEGGIETASFAFTFDPYDGPVEAMYTFYVHGRPGVYYRHENSLGILRERISEDNKPLFERAIRCLLETAMSVPLDKRWFGQLY